MKLYNTLTKKIEQFIPYSDKEVTMYTCGPTVYNYAHIGNLRTYISEDILEKSLNYLGYNVKRCMNITDVGHLQSDADDGEDKMAIASKREHKKALDIAKFYTDAFFNDMERLNLDKPKIISAATDNIDEYIKVIAKLLEDGYAYRSEGNIYFDTSKYRDYYQLSGKNPDDLIMASRDSVEVDTAKKNPMDFGLWFTSSKFDNQELKWDSPWGIGYPGWHIECSCISLKYLGEYLDIHCGAIDAIFPHHTNEIAQSECYLDHKWCNYWVHMEFLNDKSGTKMSKSKENFLGLQLLIDKGYNPLSYKLFCLQSHYRNQLLFSFDSLDIAENTYHKLINRIKKIKEDDSILNKEEIAIYKKQFINALENDLNTSNALTVLYDVIKADLNNNTKLYLIKDFDRVLGLNLNKDTKINDELKNYIEKKIKERIKAKSNKNFELADSIRKELNDKGIILNDTREGTNYEIGGKEI